MKQYLNGTLKLQKEHFFRPVIVLVIITVVLSSLLSCGKNPTPSTPVITTQPFVTDETPVTPEPPSYLMGTIDTGASKAILDETVPDSGGEIIVNQPGSPIDGLSINIPEGAYTGAVPVKISTSPINSTTFENVNAITPLIHVDNGGEFANEMMTVEVPVTVPEGQFAMGFYYNEDLQMLEAIPTVAMDEDSITLGTCHFSDFFISTIGSLLLENPDIDSHFWLLRDNWQFTNPTVAFSAGICAGMSVSSIYYYYMRPDGPGQLYGRYAGAAPADAPATIWEDDITAIRLAASVQADYEDFGTAARLQYQTMLKVSDNATVKEFAYAMMVMGGPQLALLPQHAMVATAVKGNTILICDPNFPDELRPTHWENGKLLYFDGTADQPIEFMAVGALCPWKQIGKRWAELRTVQSSDMFPSDTRVYAWSLGIKGPVQNPDGTDLEITDGISVPFEQFTMFSATPGWSHAWGGSFLLRSYDHYYKDSSGWRKTSGAGASIVNLSPGGNEIGFELTGTTTGGKYGDAKEGWLDFKWMTINYQPLETLKINPASWSGEPDQTKVFTVTSPTTLTGLWFKWFVNGVNVQEGPKQVYELNPDRATTYDISVEAWNIATRAPYMLKTAAAFADTRETATPTWSPPKVDTPTVTITSHAEGDTVTSSPFSLTVEYAFPNPEGGRIVVTVTPTDSLDNPNASWSQTIEVTNQSGTFTFEPEIKLGTKSGQLLVEVHISAPAVNLWGNDEYINLNIEIP